jgi:hypothetical protein
MFREPVFETYESYEEGCWCSVSMLNELTSLTHLTLNVSSEECTEVFWRSMALLTSLKDLYIKELDGASFGGIVRLVTCKELTNLLTCSLVEFLTFRMTVSLPMIMHCWSVPVSCQ